MSREVRDRVLEVFRVMGRAAVSRQSLSYSAMLGYPSLDPVLHELVAEGLLKHLASGDKFTPEDQLRATSKLIEETKAERQRVKAFAEELARREQARTFEAEIARQEAEQLKAAQKIERERVLAEKRLARQKSVDEYLAKRAAHIAERAAMRAQRKLEQGEARKSLRNVRLEYKPEVKVPLPKPANTDDPWAKIKARHYGRPAALPSELRELTPEEKMTGRRLRQA